MSVFNRKLLRDARAKRAQFIAIVVTVFLGVALYAASYDAFLNLQSSYQSLYEDLHFADFTLVGGSTDGSLPVVTDVDGVAAVTTRTVAETPIRIGGEHKLLGRVVSVPPTEPPAVNAVMVLKGDYLGTSDEGVLLEQHMADHFRLNVGDTVEVLTDAGWAPHDIRGIVASPEYLWPARSRQEILTSPDDFGVLFAEPAVVETLAAESAHREAVVLFDADRDPAVMQSNMKALATEAGVSAFYSQELQPSQSALQEDVSGFGEMSFLFPMLFLGGAGLATSVLLTRLVLSQRPHIGLLRANGFRRRTIFSHYLAYGVGSGLLGAIPGAVAGVLLARTVTGLYTGAISVPVTVIEFRPSTLAVGVVFGLLGGALSAVGPAVRAARMDPAEAMRGGPSSTAGGPSLIERLVPALRRLPAGAKMVFRSIERSPGRNMATAIGVILAAVLIVSSWGMIDTMQILLSRQFEQVQRQDAQVFVSDAEVVADLSATPGVKLAEPSAVLPVALSGEGDPYATSLTAWASNTAMHEFLLETGSTMIPPSEGVYLGSSLRSLAGLEIGDSVTIALGDGAGVITEPVAGFVNEPLGTVAYMTLPRLAADLGVDESTLTNSAMLQYTGALSRDEMRSTVAELPGVTAYVDSQALFDTANSFMGLFYIFVGVMLLFGGIMAFALIFNTMSANIAERAGEVGTLKAAGVRRAAISRLIISENALLVLISIGPGLIAGYLSARAIMASFSSDLFSFDAIIRPTTFLFTGLAIVVAGLLSQRPLLKRIQELDVSTVVRERSL